MRTIPGAHFHLGTRQLFTVSEAEADYNHLFQTLTGDATDGYSGCPGVGKVTAAKLLDGKSYEEMWDVVVRAYKKAGLGEEEAIQQARVARICRASDFNSKTGEVILWNPPTIK
jgi:5'-3' exonuclease